MWYGFTEDHVLKSCTGEWAKPMLEDLRGWMCEKVVPVDVIRVLRVGYFAFSLFRPVMPNFFVPLIAEARAVGPWFDCNLRFVR